jgi:hypothetical protein
MRSSSQPVRQSQFAAFFARIQTAAAPSRYARGRAFSIGINSFMHGPSGALVQVTEHLSGLTKPTARGRDLRGISAVLVVAVLWSFRGATAVCTTVHSAPSPASDRRRLAWRARPGLAHFPTRCHYSVFGGTTRNFFFASARSIARSASATASDLLAVRPPTETPVSSETDHFHTCRPTP